MRSLLPLNSTPLERAIEAAIEEQTPILLRTLYSSEHCPAHVLPWLAWAWSVDRWDSGWPEAVKRRAIRSAFAIHQRKGTIGALRRVVEPLGYRIDVTEWWHHQISGIPGTFAIEVGVLDTGITDEMFYELERLIDDAKPVSRHLIGLDIVFESQLHAYAGVVVYDGDIVEAFPWSNPDVDVSVQGFAGLGLYVIDEVEVYPHGR